MNTAIFLDTDNIRFSHLNRLGSEPDYSSFFSSVSEGDRIHVAKAYLDPERHPQRTKDALEIAGFDIIYTPVKVNEGRTVSKADVYMTMDVLESVYEHEGVDHYILCTGDGDFSRLITRLIVKHSKRVTIFAVRGSISYMLEQTGAEVHILNGEATPILSK